MAYDRKYIAEKLIRWEKFLNGFNLPKWEELPKIDLYMDQVIILLNDYLSYFTVAGSEEKLLTPMMVNNYVKLKIIPAPVAKKYSRSQIAALIMVCTLKQTLGMSEVKKMLPHDADEETIKRSYSEFTKTHKRLAVYFSKQVKSGAEPVFKEDAAPGAVDNLVISTAVVASLAKLVTEKILALQIDEENKKD